MPNDETWSEPSDGREGANSSEGGDHGRPSSPALRETPPAPPAKAGDTARTLDRLRAVGKPLAVGALALAAEAATIWLTRRAGREASGPKAAIHPKNPASRVGDFEPEGYYEEVLLVIAQGRAQPGQLLVRRSGVFGRYTGGR